MLPMVQIAGVIWQKRDDYVMRVRFFDEEEVSIASILQLNASITSLRIS